MTKAPEEFMIGMQRHLTASLICAIFASLMAGVVTRAEAQAVADTGMRVPDIIARFYTAIGGRDEWERQGVVARVFDRPSGGGTRTRTYEIRDLRRQRSYIRIVDGDGSVIERGYDGTRAWDYSSRARGYRDVVPNRTRITSTGPDRLRDYVTHGTEIRRLADTTYGGSRVLVLCVTDTSDRGQLVPVRFYIDPVSFLLRGIERPTYGSVQSFDDYRRVGARLVPFLHTNTIQEQPDSLRYERYVVDIAVSDSLYMLPTRDVRDRPLPRALTEPRSASSQYAPGSFDNLEPSLPTRTATLDAVWKTVARTFWDTTFNGRDWTSIRASYERRLNEPANSTEFHAVLTNMVQQLGVSHFHVFPPRTTAQERGRSWLPVRTDAGGALLITNVDSSQYAAGVRPGMSVVTIGGASPEQLLERGVQSWWPPGKSQAREEAVMASLSGKPGDSIPLVVELAGARRTVHVPLRDPGTMRLSPDDVVRARRLASGIGYVQIEMFVSGAGAAVQRAIASLSPLRALILDLRGNPGGDAKLLRDVATLFYRKAGTLGTSVFRYGREELSYTGSPQTAFDGPMVVLVDGWSGSCSEVLAAALQESGRAVVVGDTTAGAVLPSQQLNLPTGGKLQYPVADFVTAGGIRLEGRGVIPDVIVRYQADALLAGRDEGLLRAESLLLDRSPRIGRAWPSSRDVRRKRSAP